ncbi:ABC transporter substrate-binding protein [Williamsia sterculiae]|uniref:Peptide/nickel transport system substrate-binding protein n=1 Tax=Williamsia sterculiae TaxID=1344003 RepID=A0A1N7HD41_9NOCA|nr:ABC transporter substrate-binding protein [Williamsia sterculiae]SIS22732.1 peptide/nickel transport system substrate-binding protein [Williamsia sterculiae]
MTGLTRRAFLTALGSVGAAGALAGCTSAVEQARRVGTGAGRPGGTLVIGSLTDIDPKTVYTQSITTMTLGLLLWDTLIRYDRRTLQPLPSVATAFERSQDGTALRLTLRDDVTFHTGRPLTSADVAYAVATYASDKAGSQLQSTASAITVETPDPHTAVLRSAKPIGNIFDLLEFMLLTDRETAAELQRGETFVGTGPFRFTGRQTGAQADLARYDGYWNGPAALDGVRLRVVRDSGALLTSVRAGQSDLVLDAAPQSLRPFHDSSLWRVESEDVDDVAYYVGANVADPRLSDKRVRQAISYAVDRGRIADEVFVRRAHASSAPWAQTSPAYDPQANARYARDLDHARSLLAEAGWRNGSSLTLSYGTGLAVAPSIAAVIQNNLAEIGITVQLDPREQAAFNPFLKSGKHQLWINPHGFGQSNPATLATGAAPFKPKGNLSAFSSSTYTDAVARITSVVDPRSADARAAYAAYTDILLDEQFVIDLVITTSTNVSPLAVKGLGWNTYKYIDAHRVTVR